MNEIRPTAEPDNSTLPETKQPVEFPVQETADTTKWRKFGTVTKPKGESPFKLVHRNEYDGKRKIKLNEIHAIAKRTGRNPQIIAEVILGITHSPEILRAVEDGVECPKKNMTGKAYRKMMIRAKREAKDAINKVEN